MLNITLTAVTLPETSRTTGNGEYDKTVAAFVASGWPIGLGAEGITPAQHAGLRGAINRHNEKVGKDSPDFLSVSFHVTAKGADEKPSAYSFRRNPNDAVRRGRKPAATVAKDAPVVQELTVPAAPAAPTA